MSAGYSEDEGVEGDFDDVEVSDPGVDVEGETAQPAANAIIIAKDRTSCTA
jgi:hypothetical protein